MKTLLTIGFLFPIVLFSQCLEELVSINCNPCSREEALEKLQDQVTCSFSFNATHMDLEEQLNLNLSEVNLSQALSAINGNHYNYRQRGRHLLFLEKKTKTEAKPSRKSYTIEGYVRDAITGQVVSSATVYTVGDKYSALTNESGFYRIELNTNTEYVGLSYSKQQYLDTIVIVKPVEDALRQDMRLEPRFADIDKMPTIEPAVPERIREVEQLPMVKIFVPEKQSKLALNTAFLESIPVQFSVVPSVGTNRFTSGMKENIFSLNLFAGYNAAVSGVEMGSLLNIVRKDVNGFQASGFGNIVGGEVKGVQAAGFFNNVRGSIKGLQAAGFYNIVLDTIQGVQAAGAFNVLNGTISGGQLAGIFNVATENMEGLQAAGLINYTKGNVKFAQTAGLINVGGKVEGVQVAGLANFAKGNVTGLQAAGLFNYAKKDVEGVQIAGFTNIGEADVEGSQVSGFVNTAKDVTGTQLSGFLNVGRDSKSQFAGFMNVGHRVEGIQIGFLNFSDTTSGSFGFLSFSLKGMHHLDLGADEVHPGAISFRTGSHLFYNILQFGFGSYYPTPLWSYGYGVGTHLGDPNKRATIHLELTGRQLFVPNKRPLSSNLNMRFEPSVAYRVGKKRPYLVAGPSMNLIFQTDQLVSDDLSSSSNPFAGAYPPIFKAGQSTVNGYFWVGARVALRI